jgi:hypothetical protein
MGTPIFFHQELLSPAPGVKPTTRGRRHPGQRARRQSALDAAASRSRNPTEKGGIEMAKKAAKGGAKKKASKKK